MHLGLPTDLTWYSLLRDQGGLLGGAAALAAGLIAFFGALGAARMQVGTMRDQITAADRQTAAARDQLEEMKARAAIEDARRGYAAAWSLTIETLRAGDAAQRRRARFAENVGGIEYKRTQMQISAGDRLRGSSQGVELLRRECQVRVYRLIRAIDECNSFIETTGGNVDWIVGSKDLADRLVDIEQKAKYAAEALDEEVRRFAAITGA
jgi:Tfp pilus assembly protein PilV